MSITTSAPTTFINEWLEEVKSLHPMSQIVQGIADATMDGKLDETKLKEKFFEIVRPAEEKGED